MTLVCTVKMKFLKLSRILNLAKRSSSHNATSDGKIKLVLYTKSNCSLCDTAKEFIEDNYPDKFLIEEIDITKDKTLFRKFKLDIPVFYYQGSLLMQHRAEKSALDKLIYETLKVF